MVSEQAFVRSLVKSMTDRGWHVQRLEDKFSVGIPDINACKDGDDIWLEAKVFAWPKRATTKTKICVRPYQVSWAHRRIKAGGTCFLIAFEFTTNNTYLFDWKDFIKWGIVPFARPRAELEAMAVAVDKTTRIPDLIYNRGEHDGV